MKKLLPPRIFQVALLLIIGIHFFLPMSNLAASPLRYLGLLLMAAGSYLNLHADYLFKQFETTVKPFAETTLLIKEGPFRYSRNPMYLGMTFILLGATILSMHPGTFAIPFIFALIIKREFILPEEQKMQATFGKMYDAYLQQVPRWV